jgi:hypothetical protein
MTSQMFWRHTIRLSWLLPSVFVLSAAQAQVAPDLTDALDDHRTAMRSLAMLDGLWRGSGSTILSSGERQNFTQTIRVGPFLEGSLRFIEARTYGSDGLLAANSLEIISYNPTTKAYTIRWYGEGSVADLPITLSPTGFSLEYPAGKDKIRFTVGVANSTWTEIAERISPGKAPVRFIQLTLRRLQNTDWPAGGSLPSR